MAFFGRGKNKIQSPYVMKDFYEAYKKEVDEGSPYDIDYSTFRDLVEAFYKEIADYILEGGLYILPYNLGEVSVTGKRPKKLDKESLPIDWEETIKHGKQIRHLNEHSNYYKFRFRWSKKYRHFKNKTQYRLVFTRDNKRKLAKKIKSGDYNYFDND